LKGNLQRITQIHQTHPEKEVRTITLGCQGYISIQNSNRKTPKEEKLKASRRDKENKLVLMTENDNEK
jgi:hypothetical protein